MQQGKQDSLFTTEQMSGSGQTDMVASINAVEDRKKQLREERHTFWSDPSHGWLEVSYADLRLLGIWGKISGCSYRDGDRVYLEEDMDLGIYCKALFGPQINTEARVWARNYWTNIDRKQIFIRNLPYYTP